MPNILVNWSYIATCSTFSVHHNDILGTAVNHPFHNDNFVGS